MAATPEGAQGQVTFQVAFFLPPQEASSATHIAPTTLTHSLLSSRLALTMSSANSAALPGLARLRSLLKSCMVIALITKTCLKSFRFSCVLYKQCYISGPQPAPAPRRAPAEYSDTITLVAEAIKGDAATVNTWVADTKANAAELVFVGEGLLSITSIDFTPFCFFRRSPCRSSAPVVFLM